MIYCIINTSPPEETPQPVNSPRVPSIPESESNLSVDPGNDSSLPVNHQQLPWEDPSNRFGSWSAQHDFLRRPLEDGQLRASYIKLILEYLLSRKRLHSSLDTEFRISPELIRGCIRKARSLRLSWDQIKDVDADVLRRVLFPPRISGTWIEPDFSQVDQWIKRNSEFAHRAWFVYACEHHPHRTYSMSHFCALYKAWQQGIPTANSGE